MNFSKFNMDPRLNAGIEACGYGAPTPIQNEAIPPAMLGKDVMGLAQTGTGKTAAFALPIMQRLLQGQRGGVRALILAPTRELAEQIRNSFRELGRKSGLVALSIYGGASMSGQIKDLRHGADIVVACPGRLLDHMTRRTIDLSRLEVLVLDEADMMLDMGFLPDIKRILGHLPTKRQNMMFSATMPNEIRSLSTSILRDPTVLQVSSSSPVETVSHALYPVSQNLKTPLLIELLKKTDAESVLIFTRTKHRAKKLGMHLEKLGHKAASLQGNLSQGARQAALNGFRAGRYNILVATDIAARGIDVSQVTHVINYDIPDTTAAYTHRIGRTGRALRTGDAFTLVAHEDGPMVRDIERVLGSSIERRTVDGFDYKQAAPAQKVQFARDPRSQPPRQNSRGASHSRPVAARISSHDRQSGPKHNSQAGRTAKQFRQPRGFSAGNAGYTSTEAPRDSHKSSAPRYHGNANAPSRGGKTDSRRPDSRRPAQAHERPAFRHNNNAQPSRPAFGQFQHNAPKPASHDVLIDDLNS